MSNSKNKDVVQQCSFQKLWKILLWNLAKHMKKWNKEHQTLSFPFFINKSSILMHFILFFRVVCKISNFNMWTVTHLARVCKNPMSFGKSFLYLVDFIDTRHSLLVQLTIWLAKSYNFKRLKVYEIMFTTCWASLLNSIKYFDLSFLPILTHKR